MVFGLIIAFLVVAGLGALAVYTGTIKSPIDEPIHTPSAEDTTIAPACVPQTKKWPDGAPPVAYNKVKLRVYNAADYSFGIAGANADVLADRGFDIVDNGDFTRLIDGSSEIRYGRKGIRQAYTLAAQFPDVRLVLDDRKGSAIDLLVGSDYSEPLPVEDVPLTSGEPMPNLDGCEPVSEIDPVPREYGLGRDPDADADADQA